MSSTSRPLRFGLMSDLVTGRDELVETARRAESLGFSTYLMRDHFTEEDFGPQLAPIAALATAAAVTTRLRVGSLVFCNDYRHPALLAKEAATLDVLSGGRFELGLGAGFSRGEYARAGIPFDVPRARVDRLEESIEVLTSLFGGTPATHAGRHYTISALEGFPTPLQRPRPPLLIAGNGRRMLAIAARRADIVNLMPVTTTTGAVTDEVEGRLATTVEERIAWIRRAAGERLDRLELSTGMALRVTDDPVGAAEGLMRDRGWEGVTPEQVLEMPTVFMGTVEEIVETLLERRRRYGFSYYVVPQALMEAAAPIVERAAGR